MDEGKTSLVEKSLSLALYLWSGASIFFVFCNGALYFWKGPDAFHRLIQRGPFSITTLTFASVAVVWSSLGAALVLLQNRRLRTRHGLTVICTLLLLLLYANILRERTAYGDVGAYIRAARDLVRGASLDSRYLYPPFLATILTPLARCGDTTIGGVCWAANLLSLGLFVVLLRTALVRYGFGNRLSVLLVFLLVAINAPILRTLLYVQINLHVANLILIALLAFPRLPFLSAAALALAVHLKASPIVLALPFVLNRNWRWSAWFAAMLAAFAGVTVGAYGWQPFLDFIHNVRNIHDANGIVFRDTSVDSFFRSSATALGFSPQVVLWPILVAKLGLLAAVLLTMVRVERNRAFVRDDQPGQNVRNAVPVLLLFMLLGSPLVWEHHAVFVALTYLLVLKRLATPGECVWFGAAYVLEYLLPTFDFYPWSFGRLLSPLILLGLIYATARRSEDDTLLARLSHASAS